MNDPRNTPPKYSPTPPILSQSHSHGAGVLAVWTDARQGDEIDFNDWYNRDHLPERTSHPGFLNGRRYRAISGSPRYLALYDTHSPDALSHRVYRKALENPSPWTQRIMPSFQNFTRSVFIIDCRFGAGQGGVIATIRPRQDRAAATGFQSWLVESALPAVMQCDGVVGAEYLTLAPGFAPIDVTGATEGALRTKPDSIAPWAITISATEPGLLRAALTTVMPRKTLRDHAGGAVKTGVYRLLYSL